MKKLAIAWNATLALLYVLALPIYAAKWLSDLEISYNWRTYTFAVGAENLFDTFPDKNLRAGIPSGSAQVGSAGVFLYPINSPFGMNGRFVYTRVSYRF